MAPRHDVGAPAKKIRDNGRRRLGTFSIVAGSGPERARVSLDDSEKVRLLCSRPDCFFKGASHTTQRHVALKPNRFVRVKGDVQRRRWCNGTFDAPGPGRIYVAGN